MANDTDVVNQEPQIENLPDPQISGKPAGQPLDQAGGSTVTLEDLRDMVREEMQSIKDTRIGKSETRLDNLEGAIARYEAEKGGTVDAKALSTLQEAQELSDIKSQLASLLGGKVPEASTGVGEKDWKKRRASILSDAGIKSDDPRVVDMLRKENFESHDSYIEALQERANEWSFADEKKPKPSSSTVAQVIPSVPTGDGTYNTDKYVEDMLANRGNKGKLDAIRAKAQADGLDIDRISINM